MKNTRTVESQMRESYLDYAMAVIVGRGKSVATIETAPSITNDMPESGGGGESAGVTDGPEVAASDDDGDSDDGDPDRRSSLKKPSPSGKHRNVTAMAGALPSPQNPDIALWRLPTVLAHIPVSRSHWWAGVASGRYPAPVKLSTRCVAWRSADIRALIASF